MLNKTPNRQNKNFQRNGNCIPWSQPRHRSWVSASEAQIKKKRLKQVGLLLPPSPRFAALWETKGLQWLCGSMNRALGWNSGKSSPFFLLCHWSAGKTEHFPLCMFSNGNFQSRENFSYLKYPSELGKIKSEMWKFPQMENFIFGECREHSSSPMVSCQRGIPVSCPAPGTSKVWRNLLWSYWWNMR